MSSAKAIEAAARADLNASADDMQRRLDEWPNRVILEVPRAAMEEAIAILQDAAREIGQVAA